MKVPRRATVIIMEWEAAAHRLRSDAGHVRERQTAQEAESQHRADDDPLLEATHHPHCFYFCDVPRPVLRI